jgi:hypothetical protein
VSARAQSELFCSWFSALRSECAFVVVPRPLAALDLSFPCSASALS